MPMVYSMLDRKMREFGPLMVAKNDETIRRFVLDGVRGSKSLQELHAGDFDVFCVGAFDQDNGQLSVEPLRLVANVGELLEAANAG